MVSGFSIQNESKCFYEVFFSPKVISVIYWSVTSIILLTPLCFSIVFDCDLFLSGYCFLLIFCGVLGKSILFLMSLLVDGTVFGVDVSGSYNVIQYLLYKTFNQLIVVECSY